MFNVLYSLKWFFCVKLCYEKFFNRRDIKLEEKNNIIKSLSWLPTFDHLIILIFLCFTGNEAYVWLYDPTPWYYYIAGTAIVLGIIAVCLFPLWPIEMRQVDILQFLTSLGMVNYLFNQLSHVLHPS